MTAPRLGLVVLLATLVLDQASKLWLRLVADLEGRSPIGVLPVLDLDLVWNRGISYGLFQQDTEAGRWLLFAGTVVAAVAITVWMLRSSSRLLAASLGLIAGGAVGNAVDRLAYGAVMDFVHLHYGSFSWYVFNVADAAIVAGVAGVLYDSFVLERRASPPRQRAEKPDAAS